MRWMTEECFGMRSRIKDAPKLLIQPLQARPRRGSDKRGAGNTAQTQQTKTDPL